MDGGETISRNNRVGAQALSNIKDDRDFSTQTPPLVKQNRLQRLAQLTSQYNTVPSRILSEKTIQITLLNARMGLMSHSCAPVVQSSSSNTATLGPGTS